MPADAPLARIFRQPKSAMQSGGGSAGAWMLVFAPAEAQRLDPMTGWAGSGDTMGQLRLRFATQMAAVAYAEGRGIAYEVEAEAVVRADTKPKAYADNFRFGRTDNWSH